MKPSSKVWRIHFSLRGVSVLLLELLVILAVLSTARADGCFVVRKFVWDKHKDINEPTQKAIIVWDEGREDLILQVKYDGPVDEFGWLVPVPSLPVVQKGSMDCFYELSRYTQQHFGPQAVANSGFGGRSQSLGGEEPTVKVIETKTVGAYEVAVLSAKDAGSLETWLKENEFAFPSEKGDVFKSYIDQGWYFVAVKIQLHAGMGFKLSSSAPKKTSATVSAKTRSQLAKGELQPLHLSFATDKCVFPLKISSVNGKPSEVQLYVLSPQPLIERRMYEKRERELAVLKVQTAKEAKIISHNLQALRLSSAIYAYGGKQEDMDEPDEPTPRFPNTPEVHRGEELPYANVTTKSLPQCARELPRMKGKSWWLTKQTWTFQPEEMRDLEFEPAIPVLAEKLGDTVGYYAAANLRQLGNEGVARLMIALRGTNSQARINTASSYLNRFDQNFHTHLSALFHDSEPEVRWTALETAITVDVRKYASEFAHLINDEVPEIRDRAASGLGLASFSTFGTNPPSLKYAPQLLALLKHDDPADKVAALRTLRSSGLPLPREQILPLLKETQSRRVLMGYSALRESRITCDEAIPLLRHSRATVKIIGLRVLYENAEKQSVELALPLLRDSKQLVRNRAAATLRALTGQHFTADQAKQWQTWWAENKSHFTIELHPDELKLPGFAQRKE